MLFRVLNSGLFRAVIRDYSDRGFGIIPVGKNENSGLFRPGNSGLFRYPSVGAWGLNLGVCFFGGRFFRIGFVF